MFLRSVSPGTVNYNRKWPGVGKGLDEGGRPECTKYCARACKTNQSVQNQPSVEGGGGVCLYGIEMGWGCVVFRVHFSYNEQI